MNGDTWMKGSSQNRKKNYTEKPFKNTKKNKIRERQKWLNNQASNQIIIKTNKVKQKEEKEEAGRIFRNRYRLWGKCQ